MFRLPARKRGRVERVPGVARRTEIRRFEAKISGPPSCYGKNGQSRIEHSGVVFFFDSYTSSCFHSTVQSGQFSEFLFLLV